MKGGLKVIIGAFALLRRRAGELGRPGLGIYADAGSAAAVESGEVIRDLAHKNETAERQLSARIKGMLADGRIDEGELDELRRVPQTLTRCAERSHDITEVVA